MPKEYEEIRDKSVAEGMSYDASQAKAARIYNSQHPGHPVSNTHHDNPGHEGATPSHKHDRLMKKVKSSN